MAKIHEINDSICENFFDLLEIRLNTRTESRNFNDFDGWPESPNRIYGECRFVFGNLDVNVFLERTLIVVNLQIDAAESYQAPGGRYIISPPYDRVAADYIAFLIANSSRFCMD